MLFTAWKHAEEKNQNKTNKDTEKSIYVLPFWADALFKKTVNSPLELTYLPF